MPGKICTRDTTLPGIECLKVVNSRITGPIQVWGIYEVLSVLAVLAWATAARIYDS